MNSEARVVRFAATGGPEVLQVETMALATPDANEVLVKQNAIGVNYIDTYHRSGLYPVPALPSGLGLEAAGIVEAVGPAVTEFKPGDRVAYGTGTIGAYANFRLVSEDRLVPIPDGISDIQAAAMMLRGMTAEYLLQRTYPVKNGDWVLVHAAAGGVGIILSQWAKARGANVIGTVGSDEKARLAKAHGCDHVILYRTEDWVTRVRDLTQGRGVDVVFDGVGKDTFLGSLDCLKPRGMMVSFGNASGPADPISPLLLAGKGSLFLTRPTLGHYTATRDELLESARSLFDVVVQGKVKLDVIKTYPLTDAAQAHRDLEGRKTTGSVVLVP